MKLVRLMESPGCLGVCVAPPITFERLNQSLWNLVCASCISELQKLRGWLQNFLAHLLATETYACFPWNDPPWLAVAVLQQQHNSVQNPRLSVPSTCTVPQFIHLEHLLFGWTTPRMAPRGPSLPSKCQKGFSFYGTRDQCGPKPSVSHYKYYI
jgi:hypothetical protein